MTTTPSDILGDEPDSRLQSPVSAPQRSVDRLDPRIANLLTVVGFGIPIAAYFWLLDRYSLNVILGDPWDDVNVINHSYTHLFDWGSLWAQHNENRIFFPNLIVLLLAYTTHYNVQVEEYLGAAMLMGSTALVIWAHKRRSRSTPWLYYCPVAILMLSFVQHGNTLYGFQLAWYLVLFAVVTALIVLDRTVVTWGWLIFATVSAVVASYSSLEGLFVWPTGLFLLYLWRRPKSFAIAWISAAILTTVVYFAHFTSSTDAASAIQHPIASIEFFFVAVGDVVGVNVSGPDATGIAVLLFGLVIVLLSIWVLFASCRGRDAAGGSQIAPALICFGLLFAASLTVGLMSAGWPGASPSRYRTFDLLIVVGLYLAVLDRCALRWRADEGAQPSEMSGGEVPVSHVGGTRSPGPFAHRGSVLMGAVVVAIVCLQIGIGVPEGLAGARVDHTNQVLAARVLVNIDKYPDNFVRGSLAPFYQPAFIRRMAQIAKVHRLSLFATNSVAEYKAQGLVADPSTLSTRITIPTNGVVLKGTQILNATAIDSFGVTKVEFTATGEGLSNAVVGSAVMYQYGWIAAWRTATVPNGFYVLESVAYNGSGRVAHSRSVSVVVKN